MNERWVLIYVLVRLAVRQKCSVCRRTSDFLTWSWWRHQRETFSSLLAFCAGNSPVTGDFPAERPVTRALMFSLMCAWINSWVNNREAGNLRPHRAHYDVNVMTFTSQNKLICRKFDYGTSSRLQGSFSVCIHGDPGAVRSIIPITLYATPCLLMVRRWASVIHIFIMRSNHLTCSYVLLLRDMPVSNWKRVWYTGHIFANNTSRFDNWWCKLFCLTLSCHICSMWQIQIAQTA